MELLRNKFIKLMNEYEDELAEARRTNNFKRPLGDFVRHDIAGDIENVIDTELYKVKASVGAGRWTDVPWIAVFDKRITTKAQKGVYIVYLLNKVSKTLYLTLNQGATAVSQSGNGQVSGSLTFTGVASGNNSRANAELKKRADYYRKTIGNKYELRDKGINSGSKVYDAGCIFYKEYTLETIPSDEILHEDLNLFIEVYNDFYERVINRNAVDIAGDWWPSIDE